MEKDLKKLPYFVQTFILSEWENYLLSIRKSVHLRALIKVVAKGVP